jgi:polynucleotide 5'-hydroxyl-kinase GRC3/NOL9
MVKVALEMEPGDLVRVFGPATLRVSSGLVSVLGAELGEGEFFVIGELRSYVVKGVTASRIDVELEGDARVELASPEEEPYDEWVEVADSILSSCPTPCTVTVLGSTDSGKTSFTALLANRGILRGLKVAIVDADVGQADIGPPGFIGLAYPKSWVSWLRFLEPEMLRFIGSIEPSPLVGRIISACVELQAKALSDGAELIVVDSDGWVEGWAALEYKVDFVRALRSNHVVVMGDDRLAEYIARLFPGGVYKLTRPMVQATRSAEDRRRLRQENYRRFLEGDLVEVDLAKTPVYGACISGYKAEEKLVTIIEETLGEEMVELVTRYPGGACIYVEDQNPALQQAIKELQKKIQGLELMIIPLSTAKMILSALRDGRGHDCPALLVDVDLRSRKALFKTKCKGPFKSALISRIRLTEDYREAARGRIWI